MAHTVSLDAIREHMPHVDVDNLHGRSLPMHCLLDDDGEWNMWLPDANGSLCKMRGSPFEARYFAKNPASQEDIRLFFVEFLNQRANYPETHELSHAAYSDVQNLATSLAKLELMFSARDAWPGVNRMAATELEYIFLTCRSLFDIFQEVIAKLWHRIGSSDPSFTKQNLPESYRRMVLHGGKRMTVDEIVAKHQIPQQIAAAYYATSQFFEWLREYRDYIVHGGKDFECVFVGEEGFAIMCVTPPFSRMNIWCDNNTLPNNLGSLKSVACHVIFTTLQALESVIIELQTVIQFPPPTVPEYALFLCGPNVKHLRNIQDGIRDRPWYTAQDENEERITRRRSSPGHRRSGCSRGLGLLTRLWRGPW